MKISGLVRVFNRVRAQLQTGLAPEELEPFRQTVQNTVREVELICRKHGQRPEHLPGPSQRAYLFLKELDLRNLPLRQADAPAPPKPGFRIKNVVAIGETLADNLWLRLSTLLLSPEARAQFEQDLLRQVNSIEQICARHEQTPAALEAPSRRVYCWLKYLTVEDHFALQLDTLQQAKEVLAAQPASAGRNFRIHLLNMSALWRRRDLRHVTLLKFHQGFQSGDRQIWQALLQCALAARTKRHKDLISEFAASEDFSEIVFELESFAADTTATTRGRAHDLDESFARVNARYFGNQLPKPKLVWNRTLTARKFGHYQPGRDTVMLSVSLDDPNVPTLVVDFVMYHELLHKKHGAMLVNGRRLAHSPAFRAEERQFTAFHAAERQLTALALKQQGAGGLRFNSEED